MSERKIEVKTSIGLVGCVKTDTFTVDDDTSDEEIEEMAKDTAMENLNWSWKVKK